MASFGNVDYARRQEAQRAQAAAREDFENNRDLRTNLNDKAMDERIARFIQNQAEYSVVEEVNEHRDLIFQDLQYAQQQRFTELEEGFKQLGVTSQVPYEGQRYEGAGFQFNQGQYYGGDVNGYGKGRGYYDTDHGYYGQDPYQFVPPFEGKDSNTKYLDENPENEWKGQNQPDVETFVKGRKQRIDDHYMPTMSTVKKVQKDDRLHRRTVYDLAGADDWRQNTQGRHMAGPIDHVSKNKAQFSNVQQTIRPAEVHYVNKGYLSPGIERQDSHGRISNAQRMSSPRASQRQNSPGRNSPGRNSPGRNSPARNSPARNSPGRNSPGRVSRVTGLSPRASQRGSPKRATITLQ